MGKLILIVKELFSQKVITIIAFLTIFFMVILYSGFNILSNNLNEYIYKNFSVKIPPNTIKVSSETSNKNSVIDKKVIRKLKEINGVRAVRAYPVSRVPVFAVININALFSLISLNYQSDLICIGVPYSRVQKDLPTLKYRKMWKNWKPGKITPFLVPKVLVEMYNQGMAEANGLPKIDKGFLKLIMGTEIDIYWGRSSLNILDGYVKERGRLSGITAQLDGLGLIVPEKTVLYYNNKFKKNSEFIFCEVLVESHDKLKDIDKKIRSYGLRTETEFTISDEIKKLQNRVSTILSVLLFILTIILFTTISVLSLLSVLNRIKYYNILRMLGASKIYISFIIIIKYTMVGFLSSYLAVFLLDLLFSVYGYSYNIFSVKINLLLPGEMKSLIILAGSIMPGVSVFPAIFRLYFKIFV